LEEALDLLFDSLLMMMMILNEEKPEEWGAS
jgi:hypothetical protein